MTEEKKELTEKSIKLWIAEHSESGGFLFDIEDLIKFVIKEHEAIIADMKEQIRIFEEARGEL